MANDISKLSLMVTANAAGVQTGLNAASGHLGSFQNKVGSAGGSLSGFGSIAAGVGMSLGTAAVSGIVAVGAAIGGAVVSGLKMAASMQQVAVSMEVMLGSAAQAKATLAELKQFASSTPFEFPEIAEAAKKLLAFGSTSELVTPELRMLGDIASGAGIPLGELSELYGKARVQGTLFAEDINQLTGRGIPIIQEFAKQMGVTEAEVKKLASEGKIGFAQLQKAMIDLTGEGGKFEGMTQKQSTTIAGLWSTLQDTVGEQLTKIGASLIENFDLENTMQTAIKWIGLFGEKIVWLADKVGSVVKPLMQGLNAIFGDDPSEAAAKAAAKAAEDRKKLLEDNAKNQQKQKADQLASALSNTTKKLEDQIATYSMGKTEVDLYKLAQQGATQEQLESVKALTSQLDALEANKKAMEEQKKLTEEMAKDAAKYIEDIKDPWEKLGDELERINKLERAGMLTAEQAARASQKLSDELANSMRKNTPKYEMPKLTGSKATLEAVERRFTAGMTTDNLKPMDELVKLNREIKKSNEKVAKNTEKLVNGGTGGKLLEIAP